MNWFLFWLLLHITAAVIGFGPAFSFPFLGFSAHREPQHLSFALGVIDLIHRRLILPVTGTMLISGVALIITGHINIFQTPWLLAGVILYIAVMGLASGHQGPTGLRVIALVRDGGAPGSQLAPEVAALLERLKRVSMVMLLTLVVIVFLMIVKPGGTTYT